MSFQGSTLLGMGFTFDDTDKKGVTSSLDDMHRLIEADPRNREVIFPYIGGEEINRNPSQSHHRFVIDFFDRGEKECREKWPALMDVLERQVKPERMKKKKKSDRERWWQFSEKRPGLRKAASKVSRVLVNSQVSSHVQFAFTSSDVVCGHTANVFVVTGFDFFALLQSRLHEVWARLLGSSMKNDLRYTASDCFETFPLPFRRGDLSSVGEQYYEFRSRLMVESGMGMTKLYGRFNNPEDTAPDIKRLREIHEDMDREVLESYGWTDIVANCDFVADQISSDEAGETGSQVRTAWRYRWPDETQDELLVRLLELNRTRAIEEREAQDPQRALFG